MSRSRPLALATRDVRAVKARSPPRRRFIVESASRCQVGIKRLATSGVGAISAVVADLSLPDRHGLETLETLLRVAPRTPSWF